MKKRADFYENIDLWKMNIFAFLSLQINSYGETWLILYEQEMI